MTREQISNYIGELLGDEGDGILLADGLDDAFIGIDISEAEYPRAVYSIEKCIAVFAKDMGQEEADEYFWYNTAGAHMGPQTPIYIHTP